MSSDTSTTSPAISCPLRNGTHVTMGLTDCIHEPMRAAIAAEGPDSTSMTPSELDVYGLLPN